MGTVIRAMLPVTRSMLDAIRLNFELEDEIEERKKVEQKLREMSLRDGLTGLSNRRHFDDAMENEFRRAQRNSYPLSLILMDIDYFKAFNDTYGHLEGDDCLQRISRSIEKALKRPADLAARYGGEELAVILPNTDFDSARDVAEALREDVQALEIPHEGSDLADCSFVTISSGVATSKPERDAKPADLIERADGALYQAKRDGRNRIVAVSG